MPEPWHQPTVGFEFITDTISVSREFQETHLGACGIDPSTFADQVDPAFFIGIGIRAGVNSGISAEGNVNMLQHLIQHRPAILDEALTVRGIITDVVPVPRGLRVTTDVWFEDASHARVLSTPRISLKPDPNATARGAGERPPPAIEDIETAAVLDRHQLTPDQVVGYSSEGNSIHYDMQAANKAGFRAPIIGGGMGVHYLNAALWRVCPPNSFEMGIYFRRPIFWDDAFTVVCSGKPGDITTWSAMGLVRDGKTLTETSLSLLPG
ncbi:MAG: hypothetical protein O3A63_10465 [Proteobacteria bacterium]|nr:hypothetical protein [Pseudomonadota bacterium]